MSTAKSPDAPSERALRREQERLTLRAARQAEALRANLQRRKSQARERSSVNPDSVDAPSSDLHKTDSL